MKKATGKAAAKKAAATKKRIVKPAAEAYLRDFTALEKIIITNLRQLRKEQGLSLSGWAKAMRVGVSYVKGYDASQVFRYVPSIEFIIRVADYCNVSVDWILGRSGGPGSTPKA